MDLIYKRSKYIIRFCLSKTILDQIIKNHYIVLYNTVFLAQENTNLYTANKKVGKKYNRTTRQIFCENG